MDGMELVNLIVQYVEAITIFAAIIASMILGYVGKRILNFFGYKIMMAKEKHKAKKEAKKLHY